MTQQAERRNDESLENGAPDRKQTRDNQENELEAEQESAAAMDADVPQPPGADETTEESSS
jgi:hypothetical protein